MWFRRKRILIICTGNTCRSPMVEGYLKKRLSRLWYKVESAGTCTKDGQPPSPKSATAMLGIGININSHRSRQVTQKMVDKADLIIALEDIHTKSKQLTDARRKAIVLGVSDPFGGDQSRYYACRNEIVDKVGRWMEAIES